MINWYFDEYLKNLPRKDWSPFDELSFLLKFRTFSGMRIFIPDGTSFTSPRRPKAYFTMRGCDYARLHGFKKGRILVYIGNSPIYLDPFSVMYFSDKDDLIDPKEYQNGNR